MANVHDVAAYILSKTGPITAMKLEKLVYYSKAWHLVWEDDSLFPEEIQAWANGPVVYELYKHHRGSFKVVDWKWGHPEDLTAAETSSIDAVLKAYGDMKSYELSQLTHREAPWRNARGDTPAGERSQATITDQAMFEYYDSLVGVGEELES